MKNKILNILRETPVNILEESDSYLEVYKWELNYPREDNTRQIGLFNLTRAAKVVAEETNSDVSSQKVFDTLCSICDTLVSEGELRISPEYRRNSFTIVEN